MEATAQLNVRLEPELKKAGDRVLAEHGLTPSQAIRALYRSITAGKEQADRAFEAIAEPDPDEEARLAERERKLQAHRSFRKELEDHYRTLGLLDTDSPRVEVPYKELLEEALYERMLEKDARSVA